MRKNYNMKKMEEQQDKPTAIRINIVTDDHSISHSEWLQYNDEFKDLGIWLEISDKGYPHMVTTPTDFTNMDIAVWTNIEKKSRNTKESVHDRLSIYMGMQTFLHQSFPPSSMDNIIDSYMTPQSKHYYLDSECSNATALIFTNPIHPLIELRDRILKSFKVNVYCNGSMIMVDRGKESHDAAIGRMSRITTLCSIQMGIPTDRHMINDKYMSYVDDNTGINAIYIY